MDFVAIDFETANSVMTSACSLGIAVVENNQISTVKEWYIKPTPFYFNYFNIQVHGITEGDVADCPAFNELWGEILPYFEGSILAAHNAPFDMTVLKQLVNHYALDAPCFEYFCSCDLSRKTWRNLQNHKLNTVCEHLDIDLTHHNAASDAVGCARIVLNAADLLAKANKKIETHIRLSKIIY